MKSKIIEMLKSIGKEYNNISMISKLSNTSYNYTQRIIWELYKIGIVDVYKEGNETKAKYSEDYFYLRKYAYHIYKVIKEI